MDFFQDRISTIHDFGTRSSRALIEDLNTQVDARRIGIVIPALLGDSRNPEFSHIMQTLKKATFVNEVVIPLSADTEKQVDQLRSELDGFPFDVRVLWCEHPRIGQLVDDLGRKGIQLHQRTGKGYAVWLGQGVAALNNDVIVMHDSDIQDYTLDLPARLAYPLCNPSLDYFFSKAYYSRITQEQFFGRVVRLFVWPYLDSLLIMGSRRSEFLQYLRAFRYPLSGEFALTSDLALNVRIPTDWGLEMSMLSEVYRNTSLKRICQVDLGTYSHKHRDVGQGADETTGLTRMVRDIFVTTLRTYTETEGFVATEENLSALRVLFRRAAQEYVRKYFADATANGIAYERHKEEATIETFAEVMVAGAQEYLQDPARQQIPDWLRILSADKDMARMVKATTRPFGRAARAEVRELAREAP